jgi:hypothetical protein
LNTKEDISKNFENIYKLLDYFSDIAETCKILEKIKNATNDSDIKNKIDEFMNKESLDIETLEKDLEEIKKLVKQKEEQALINTIIEKDYNDFTLTSKETEFSKYDKELILNRFDKKVKTKDTIIEYPNTSKNKKNSILTACFQSPLIWLKDEYKISLNNDMTDIDILTKIKKTKHFEITAKEEKFYNAISALIHKKRFNKTVFITYLEMHRQLGYKSKLRPEHKINYESMISRLSYLEIIIDFSGVTYDNYKKFYKIEGNIKEPLIIPVSYSRAKVQYENTLKILEGFETIPTKLMKLHFDHECQTNYFVSGKKKNTSKKIESKIDHIPLLEAKIKKMYHLSKKEYADIKNETLLNEFKLQEEFKKAKETKNVTRFLSRNIYNPIKSMIEVKTIEKVNNLNRIYWNKSK